VFLNSIFTWTAVAKYLQQLKRNQWRKTWDLENIQFERLKRIVHYAYEYIPYYRRLFRYADFKPSFLKSRSDLEKIPIITKNDVQKNQSNILAKGVDPSKYHVCRTSGSTGIPLKIFSDQKTYDYSIALVAYCFLECGLRLRDKIVKIGKFRFEKPYTPNKMAIPLPLESGELDLTISRLRRINPDAIYTLPRMIQSLCSVKASGITPGYIFNHAETLTQSIRDKVRSRFGIEINDTYASVEFNRLAFECNEHSGLHMLTDNSVMEFLDKGEAVSPGERGEIVVTGLTNYAMPLIRYELGDLGVPTDEVCNCGRSWPLIMKIEGRILDVFSLEGGTKIYPETFHKFHYAEIRKNPFCVSEFQIVQEKRNNIVLNFVKGNTFDQNIINKIKENIENFCNYLGEDVNVEFRIVERIPVESSGKNRKILSLIN
jgi:phenylacetate-CoA ligase